MILSFVKVIVPSSLSVAVTFANGSKVSPTFNVTSFAEIVGAVLSSPCEFNDNSTFKTTFPSL